MEEAVANAGKIHFLFSGGYDNTAVLCHLHWCCANVGTPVVVLHAAGDLASPGSKTPTPRFRSRTQRTRYRRDFGVR